MELVFMQVCGLERSQERPLVKQAHCALFQSWQWFQLENALSGHKLLADGRAGLLELPSRPLWRHARGEAAGSFPERPVVLEC